jgi:hypothetical protein
MMTHKIGVVNRLIFSRAQTNRMVGERREPDPRSCWLRIPLIDRTLHLLP